MYRRWTDEDAAFATAQWGGGIRQSDIAVIFGYTNSSTICTRISLFVQKYGDAQAWSLQPWNAAYVDRKLLAKAALAAFILRRIRREIEQEITQ